MDTREYFKVFASVHSWTYVWIFIIGDLCFGWRVGSFTGLIITTRRGCISLLPANAMLFTWIIVSGIPDFAIVQAWLLGAIVWACSSWLFQTVPRTPRTLVTQTWSMRDMMQGRLASGIYIGPLLGDRSKDAIERMHTNIGDRNEGNYIYIRRLKLGCLNADSPAF